MLEDRLPGTRKAKLQLASTLQTSRSQIVLCLAGHIDHGKSSLVRALTGGNVDRLPEEKRRGMTIDLGFAHFDAEGIRFALIDVPGHERFVHTMVAGASGVDLALLVVAADDSVMPQTREHLALLELLGVRHGVIALTKCDLADAEQLELVHLEMDELVGSTFLAQAPVIEISTRAGFGIVELQATLVEIAQGLPVRAVDDSRFRLPIDRAFSPSGQGTVVTGTVWKGTARVGDTLDLLPAARPVRIRRLQSQGADVETISAGERAAINLSGIKATAIRRGDELATPQSLEPSRRHLVHLRTLRDAAHGLTHRDLVRLHLGATQVTAQVLMGQREVSPGEGAFAVVRCATPIVADYGQPLIVRQLSPARTIGGGMVIAPALRPTDRLNRCLAAARGLSDQDPEVRLAAYVDFRREAEFDGAIEARIGLSRLECEKMSRQLIEQRAIVRTADSQPRFVSTHRFDQLKQQMIGRCQSELDRRRPTVHVPISVVLSAMSREASLPVLNAVLADLTEQGALLRRGNRIGPPSGARLSHRQRRLLEVLLAEFDSSCTTPPTLKDFADRNTCSLSDLESLVQVAVDEGHLVRLSPELVINCNALETLRLSLVDYFQKHTTARISEIREHWQMTRKHAVPIFEFFDRRQVTLRSEDVRTAGPRLTWPIDEIAS